jgi:hypothetical protein
MFIEFETSSGPMLLNVNHIMQVRRSSGRSDITEIIFANGGSVDVLTGHQEACDSIERLVADHAERGGK